MVVKKKMAMDLAFFLSLLCVMAGAVVGGTELKEDYYSKTCPGVEGVVRWVMKKAMMNQTRNMASVMRLQFHDCFVNGCDASVLLDDTADVLGEKLALSNINSLRSFEVIDNIKEAVERLCPGVVSCADILVMAARDAVRLTGGPYYAVKMGREDGKTVSQEDSSNIMPSPRRNATSLIDLFQRFNLSAKDMVALSGSHSIGEARCFSIYNRLYNYSGTGGADPAMDPYFRDRMKETCPEGGDGNKTVILDSTPAVFDNRYFGDLINHVGYLNSDQTLYTEAKTRCYVKAFWRSKAAFFKAFVQGMLKMGDLQSGAPGEIRRDFQSTC